MSMVDRWNEEGLGEGSVIYPQCKTCQFRDKLYVTFEDEYDKKEFGWRKVYCQIYGKKYVLNTNILVPYLPINIEDKPIIATDENDQCKTYKKETRSKDETYNEWINLKKRYKEAYAKEYKLEELNEFGVPIKKSPMKEALIWKKIKEEFPEMDIKLK